MGIILTKLKPELINTCSQNSRTEKSQFRQNAILALDDCVYECGVNDFTKTWLERVCVQKRQFSFGSRLVILKWR